MYRFMEYDRWSAGPILTGAYGYGYNLRIQSGIRWHLISIESVQIQICSHFVPNNMPVAAHKTQHTKIENKTQQNPNINIKNYE